MTGPPGLGAVRWRGPGAWILVTGVTGCGGRQSVLGSESPAPEAIESLWWLSLGSTGLLAAIVLAALAWAVVRARRTDRAAGAREGGPVPLRPEPLGPEPPGAWGREDLAIAILGGGLPALFLVGFLVVSVRTGAEVAAPPEEPALVVEVVGHMFWWEVRYPEHRITTANEIRIPAGVPVEVHVTSADVIHSFWVPQLSPGKIDMIPGRTNRTWMLAEASGRYRGQCTEFCGAQHALMSLLVVAEPPGEFQEWLEERAGLQPRPLGPEEERGFGVFMAAGCAACHVIEGMAGPGAGGRPGPDLTDVGARATLGALAVENTPERLAQWILDPHRFKPGVRMPAHRLSEDDLRALVAYLRGLGT